MSRRPLYVLEKVWKFKPELKLSLQSIDHVLIRPCNVSYNTYRRFALGLIKKSITVIHEGARLAWYSYSYPWTSSSRRQFKTFEEFMIYANVQKRIVPMIENWLVNYDFKTYYAKTIDLKTNEILYDRETELLKKLSE